MKYKNIIFDLGKVLFDIRIQSTVEAFVSLGIQEFSGGYSNSHQPAFLDLFETGKMSSEQFRESVRQRTGLSLSDDQIDAAWNAMLIGIPMHRYHWLENISGKHRIYLLSNTNDIHLEKVTSMIDADYGMSKFEGLFHECYYSNRIGLRKPTAEIYHKVISDHELDLSETVFIDDSRSNIDGAIQFGLNSYHLKDDEQVETIPIFNDSETLNG